MKKHIIQQDIHTILTEEIPDDMDILPDIHRKLKQTSTKRYSVMFTLSRIAAVIAIFILVSAAGYTLYQRILVMKDLPQERITDINETQTIEDVSVTLNWAYADAHRITFAYSLEHDDLDNFINSPYVSISTADGQVLNPEYGGGGGGGGRSGESQYSERIMNFDTSSISGTPDSIDLVLTLDFSADALLENPVMMSGGGGGGGSAPVSGTDTEMPPVGGGGGGGGNMPAPMDTSKVLDRIFTFNFTLPFYPAKEVSATNNTAESNGVTMMIDNIRYTPSLTKFDLCYNMPDEKMWQVKAQIITNSPDSPFYSRQQRPISNLTQDDNLNCFEVVVTAAIADDAESFVIDILYLAQPAPLPLTDELAEAEEAYFAQQGYVIDVQADPYGYKVDVLDYPEDMTKLQAEGYIQANLFYYRHEGDWEFNIPLD